MASNERGVMLIELLTVVAIVGILSGLSMQTYSVYRTKVYNQTADHIIHDAKNALEAGKIEIGGESDGGYWLQSLDDGSLSGWHWDSNGGGPLDGTLLTPGLKVSADTRVFVSHDTWCNNTEIQLWGGDPSLPWCIVDSIQAWHCKGNSVKWWAQWNNGLIDEFEWNGVWC